MCKGMLKERLLNVSRTQSRMQEVPSSERKFSQRNQLTFMLTLELEILKILVYIS